MFKGLMRVVYRVADLEKAKQWYRTVLEKEPVQELIGAVVFQAGDADLVLASAAELASRARNTVTVYWAVDDVDVAYQRLLKAGAAAHTPIETIWTIKKASVLDPFGNVIGISSPDRGARKSTVEQRASGTAMDVAFYLGGCHLLSASQGRG